MNRKTITYIISLLLIFLFVYAATSKWMDVEKFRIELGKSPLLTGFAPIVAWGIPTLEIGISVLLALPPWRLTGLFMSFTLMCLFTAYLIAILQFSFYVPCTCGGVLQSMGWGTHIVFNIAFIVLSALGVLFTPKRKVLNPIS